MAKYRSRLPQLGGGIFITDSGQETTLVFREGIELPYFAAFHVLRNAAGRRLLAQYYERHIAIARSAGVGFILESATWRASADWGDKLGYTQVALADANRAAIELVAELRGAHDSPATPMVISACVGPRGDGYDPGLIMSTDEAMAYHSEQILVFRDTEADMVTAMTMTNIPEAIGIVRAASAAELPVAVSFTLETDGRLPTGDSLPDAIAAVDQATGLAAAYFLINCAHPSHFEDELAEGGGWPARLRGIRANASRRSHAELDAATELDAGDPVELGQDYRRLKRRFPNLTILGGCCGTDHRHVEEICRACTMAA